MSYFEAAYFAFPHLNVNKKMIRWEMSKREYNLQIAAVKHPLSPENIGKRHEFARKLSSQGERGLNSGNTLDR